VISFQSIFNFIILTTLKNKNYNPEERTAIFAERIIEFSQKIERNVASIPIISQLVKSATSIGANYCETINASSKRDFKNKIHICNKEAQETKYWLRMVAKANPKLKKEARELYKEAHELNLIFSKIISTMNKKEGK
jgi:four helix bundle protein